MAAQCADVAAVIGMTPLTSGLAAIVKTADGYLGGVDARREGVVLGD